MKISSKLFFMTFTLVAFVSVIGVTSRLYATKVEAYLTRARQAQGLARSIAEISLLSESFLAYKTVRIEEQWLARAESISSELESAEKNLPNIDSLQLLFGALIEAFDALRKIESERNQVTPEPVEKKLDRLHILETRVAARMRVNSQNLLSQVFTIADEAQHLATGLHSKAARIVAILSVVLSGIAIFFCVLLIRNLSKRLKQLTEGVTSIRQGQLSERIRLFGQDELSIYAQEFNRMVQSLEEQHLKLRQSEEQFRTLIELAPEEIFIQSEGKVAYMNNSGLKLLGASSPEQVIGKNVLELFHADEQEFVKQRFQALDSGAVDSVPAREERLLRLDGTVVPVEVVAARTTFKGKPAAQVFARDISEKLVLKQVSEQASRLAAIGTLAAGVAHEINNPNSVIMHNIPTLRAVWNDLETLLADQARLHREFTLGGIPYAELRDEMPQLLQDCIDSSQRIKRIVSDLKNFAKDDETKAGSEPLATIDLNDLVETASRLVMNRIKTSTDHFLLELSTEQPRVHGNFMRLEQVVINLLINACQALTSPAQKIRLVTRHDPEQQLTWIEVHDQGRGVSEAQLQQILEPFFTTRREAGGTGLGLSISNSIVKEHGGELIIASKPGEGTCVTITLPSVSADEDD